MKNKKSIINKVWRFIKRIFGYRSYVITSTDIKDNPERDVRLNRLARLKSFDFENAKNVVIIEGEIDEKYLKIIRDGIKPSKR